jgi:hypothetical protein
MNIGCQENIISILRIEVERLFILKSSQYNPLSSGADISILTGKV